MNLVTGLDMLGAMTCLGLLLQGIGKQRNKLIETALGMCIVGYLLCLNCELSGAQRGQSRAFAVMLALLAYRAVEARRLVLGP